MRRFPRARHARGASGGGGTGSTGSGGTGSTGSGSTTPTASRFVIESNNSFNDTDWVDVEVSSSWSGSTNVSGYFNTGYWVAPTDSVSDPASFWFKSDDTRCYRVQAWWSAASDRPEAATFMGWNEDGSEVGRAVVNQQVSGGRWNNLGAWTFDEGWNRVLLSRWTTPGYYAVADAVRLTPCP